MNKPRPIIIDGKEIEVDPNLTLLQACEQAGIEIPRFCYHERLSIAGNCRMCLVEVVGGPPKPAASCAQQVRDLRPGPEGQPPEIKTTSPMVKKAREGVMEFLLINHPLDCPICDQGGECDLQDQAMAYGVDFSRFREPKRAVDDLALGPLVKTHMTRCISCTRCVRFITEVAGVPEMGQTGRGEDGEITSYLNMALTSELQGNVVDLCPVGALTNRPYSFTARPWELKKTESIDVMDALGSNIRLDARGREVMRILPRNHDGVNEEWISDKTRHVVDGLRRQRLDKPYIRENGKLRPSSWAEALSAAADGVKGKKLTSLAGDLASVEALWALKQLTDALGGVVECRTDGAALPQDNRSAYVGTAFIEDIDSVERIMLVGTNPRLESPVLNARLRKAWLNGAEIGLVGAAADLTYDVMHVGDTAQHLADIVEAGAEMIVDHPSLVIIGQGALARSDGGAILSLAQQLAEITKSGFLTLHTAASRVGAMDIGFTTDGGVKAALKDAEAVYLLGADEIDMKSLDGKFVIYQGSHGDAGAHAADVILPGAAYTEQAGTYVNTEGRPQLAFRAGFAPGEAREDWAILRALSDACGAKLPYDSFAALRANLYETHPHLAAIDTVPENEWKRERKGKLNKAPLVSPIGDFYLTNPIARASQTMAELSRLRAERANQMAAE